MTYQAKWTCPKCGINVTPRDTFIQYKIDDDRKSIYIDDRRMIMKYCSECRVGCNVEVIKV